MFDHLPTGKWWDIGLQLVEGCTKASPACDNCWSLTAANMRQHNPNPKIRARYEDVVNNSGPHPQWTGRVNCQWPDLDKIGKARKPQVYTFWTDLFHPRVSDNFIDEVMEAVYEGARRCGHFCVICTKRPERALQYFLSLQNKISVDAKEILKCRLMLMTTAENQHWADIRLPQLLQIPGVLHGVSYEPALGPVDFRPWMGDYMPTPCGQGILHLVTAGGETGSQAWPSHPDWFRQLRDDCAMAGVPFLFKSWGEWAPTTDYRKKVLCVYDDGRAIPFHRDDIMAEEGRTGLNHNDFNPTLMSRVGKRAAGRLLDGVEHNGVPEI